MNDDEAKIKNYCYRILNFFLPLETTFEVV